MHDLLKLRNDFTNVKLGIFFKDFAHWVRSSCVGLNVAGYTTAKYLRSKGINAQAFAVRHNIDVVQTIEKYRFTHVVISAPWLTLFDLKSLVTAFPDIKFAVLSHSNIGFLQADPNAIELFRKYAEFADTVDNFTVGGNNKPFVEWFKSVYNENCILLPNLYPVQRRLAKVWDGTYLKIGAFGAIRPEKNFMTAAAAAMVIHSLLKVPMELHMSTGGDGCKSTTLPAIEEMVKDVEGVKLVRHEWQHWDSFIQLIAEMDLLIQISYTESFNMITADGISVGVPSVVSEVIRWCPDDWKADTDDVIDVANVGMQLLGFPTGTEGSDALIQHNKTSVLYWKAFLQ